MAGPLSGISGQQVPFATTFKPGGNQQESVIQQKLEEATTNVQNGQTEQTGAASSPVSQGSNSANNRNTQEESNAQSFSTSNDNGEQRRGSLLDIAV
ncbi:MAG TPA: hypothetical protein PLO23_07065 [Alphaproteobacteria bacterium]|nr:hypothetical protein [Alphaproteobacteria bacterium]